MDITTSSLHFELGPIRPAELVSLLWKENLTYTSVLPKPLKVQAFDLFCDLGNRVPVHRLRFPKDHVDWDAIDAALT